MLRSSIRQFSATAIKAKGFARAQILGTVGSVAFKETANNTKFVLYSLAVDRAPNPKNLDKDTETDWYNILTFNESHIAAFEKFLKPGVMLHVNVDLKTRPVIDEQSSKSYLVTYLTQRSFDVVKYAKRVDDVESQE